MGTPKNSLPSVFVTAAFSRFPEAFDWLKQKIVQHWGPIALESPKFDFDETAYYSKEMGEGLVKQFFLIDGLFDPARLAVRKRESNAWEAEYRDLHPISSESSGGRTLNIDPGYVVMNKLVLASTKDRAHRIYVGEGIFAEVTMKYVGGWQSYPWTYPDYLRPLSLEFFGECRKHLAQLVRQDL